MTGSVRSSPQAYHTSRADGKHSGVDAKQGVSTGSTRNAANVLGSVPAHKSMTPPLLPRSCHQNRTVHAQQTRAFKHLRVCHSTGKNKRTFPFNTRRSFNMEHSEGSQHCVWRTMDRGTLPLANCRAASLPPRLCPARATLLRSRAPVRSEPGCCCCFSSQS